MSAISINERFPNLGKLSLALIEHIVEPIIGESAIKEIKAPVVEKELRDSLANILENTEKRFVAEHSDKEVCEAILNLPLAFIPSVERAALTFINRPTDPAFGQILTDQLSTTFKKFSKEQINLGVRKYQSIFLEELVNLSGETREKIGILATLKIKESIERVALKLETFVERQLDPQQTSNFNPILFGAGNLPRFYITRKTEIERLRHAVSESNGVALTAIAGMGGVGKSVLARALANDPICAQYYPDGVLWAQLGTDATDDSAADRVLLEWGYALNQFETLKNITDRTTRVDILANLLQKRRFLLEPVCKI